MRENQREKQIERVRDNRCVMKNKSMKLERGEIE